MAARTVCGSTAHAEQVASSMAARSARASTAHAEQVAPSMAARTVCGATAHAEQIDLYGAETERRDGGDDGGDACLLQAGEGGVEGTHADWGSACTARGGEAADRCQTVKETCGTAAEHAHAIQHCCRACHRLELHRLELLPEAASPFQSGTRRTI